MNTEAAFHFQLLMIDDHGSSGRTLGSVGYNGSLVFIVLAFFLKLKSVEGEDEDEDAQVASADMTTAMISLDGCAASNSGSFCKQLELGTEICINESQRYAR